MAAQNTESFFNEIYDETYQAVLRFVTAKCGNVSDIEEIMQESYFDLYSYLDRQKPISNNEAFVITIAKKKIAKHYSMLKRIKDLFQHDLGEHQEAVNFEDEPETFRKSFIYTISVTAH